MVLKVSLNTGINRIRLEFKGTISERISLHSSVLIESDWNLKKGKIYATAKDNIGINRIRLEFKGWQPNGNQMATSWY